MEEEQGEGVPPLLGEGIFAPPVLSPFVVDDEIKDKKLTFEEASKCLNTLGKDESGVRYAYLMITAVDRKLTDISIVLNFKHVLFIDLTGNYLSLEALQVLSGMPFLLYLKAENNKIESAALNPMYYLQCLILNNNHITETCDINQPLLDNLELERNIIYTVQFDCERLKNLKELSLRGNQLMDFSGTYPSSLQRLVLDKNKITKITVDFAQLPNLKQLHLRDNQIKKLTGFTRDLANLAYLNLRNNKISKMREFRKLQCLPKLDTLIVTDNPLYGKAERAMDEESQVEEEEIYGEDQLSPVDKIRLPLIVLLPNLKRINKGPVTFEEREMAERARTKILEEMLEELSSEEDTEMPTTTDFTTDFTTETETEAGAYTTEEASSEEEAGESMPKGAEENVEENVEDNQQDNPAGDEDDLKQE